MALNTWTSNTGVNAAANAVGALLNGGYLRIYDGAQPANADTAVTTQALLAELRFANPAFGAAAAGVITANAIAPDLDAKATGTAAWFRCLETDGATAVFDGSVGTVGANLNMDSTAIQLHAEVDVTALTYTVPKQ